MRQLLENYIRSYILVNEDTIVIQTAKLLLAILFHVCVNVCIIYGLTAKLCSSTLFCANLL